MEDEEKAGKEKVGRRQSKNKKGEEMRERGYKKRLRGNGWRD